MIAGLFLCSVVRSSPLSPVKIRSESGYVPKNPGNRAMLTDTQCRTAKPKDKPYKLTNSKGLHLL